jgi:DNA primase
MSRNQWVDFREIRSQVRISDVLDHFSVKLKIRGDKGTGFCPLPGHRSSTDGKRRSPSFSVNLQKGIFQCFSCGAKGNVIDLVCYLQGLDPGSGQDVRVAALMIQERFCSVDSIPSPQPSRAVVSESKPVVQNNDEQAATGPVIVNAPLDFELKHLDPGHPYLTKRGFTQDTIAHFGIGYCSRGLMQGRIAIPLHDVAGNLIGYAGRIVDDKQIDAEHPKYLLPGARDLKGVRHEFHKSEFLYNGWRLTQPVRELIVVEGFASVWWLHQHGWRDCVALMGNTASPRQIELAIELTDPDGCIHIFTDANEAGLQGAKKLLCEFSPKRLVRWAKLDGNRQPTDLNAKDLQSLLRGSIR